MSAIGLLPLAVLCLWSGVFLVFLRPLVARWREPVLRHPVLAIESDDWGAGPVRQAELLERLLAMLRSVQDGEGRPAVMTLGVVMEVPDGSRIAADDARHYHGLPLSAPVFEPVRDALSRGRAAGVFALQLHGQCHYWPASLLAAARGDPAVRAWLTDPGPARTEALPAPLQSRWVDAAVLPSRAHDAAEVRAAVAAEAEAYRALFEASPAVAVATTFVWDEAVEAAWREAGVETVITPGRRATCRDAFGEPGCVDRRMLAGELSPQGLLYLVRDVYYEPALGHRPARLVEGLATRARQGRACLVETHRFNFLDQPDASLAQLEQGLRAALARCPELRFLAPAELGRAMRQRDPAWIETRFFRRLRAWRARLAEIPRFARVARLVGLGWVMT